MSKENIDSYLKNNGFFIPNSEIYGGFAKSWDLGPHGSELKRNLKFLWWKYFITSQPNNISCDSSILTSSKVLESSGHLKNFHDWLVECLICQKRYRLDNLLTAEEFTNFLLLTKKDDFSVQKKCPNCSKENLTKPRQFNLLLSTNLQITSGRENSAYLRPETCQGIFINFNTIQQATHRKLPFGVGQIGKSFRNEITLHHGIFRTREFEQMELEFFCQVEESEKWWNYWTEKAWKFLNNIIANNKERIKKISLSSEELPHYAQKTLDLYFNYHFGWGEVCSNSHRGDFDLTQHGKYSQQFLGVKENEKLIVPQVIEVSFGVERLLLAILEDSYQEEEIANSPLKRAVLKLSPLLAPYFVAVIPLNKQLREKSQQIYQKLLKEINFSTTYEATDNIGKSYRRQDAIGTFYCLTIDFQTLEDNTITIRERNSMNQKRVDLNNLTNLLNDEYHNHYQDFLKK